MSCSHATVAEYLRLGIESGVLEAQLARDWAMSVVERLQEPPGDIIEVSWSRTPTAVVDNLRGIEGDRDGELAGRWLLGGLRGLPTQTDEQLTLVVRQAMHIAQAAHLGDDVCYTFDRIDDALSLARTGTWGTVEGCRADLEAALADFPSPPNLFAT